MKTANRYQRTAYTDTYPQLSSAPRFSTYNLAADYENIQSRDRGSRVVAGLAAAFGGAFSCNSNKTELTVGYATFYGDICGALAPIGDLWKHHVYELGRYLNDKVFQRIQVLPEAIFTIRPSAELSSEQTVGTGGKTAGLSLSR